MKPRVLALAIAIVACVTKRERTVDNTNIPADSTCSFVRVNEHPAGDSLLAEFVRRDGAGEFTAASKWFDGAVDCPGHEPAPDGSTIVSGHDLHFLLHRTDSVRAEVRWTRVGYSIIGQDTIAPGVELDTLLAVRTAYGWRVASPALNPHKPVHPSRP